MFIFILTYSYSYRHILTPINIFILTSSRSYWHVPRFRQLRHVTPCSLNVDLPFWTPEFRRAPKSGRPQFRKHILCFCLPDSCECSGLYTCAFLRINVRACVHFYAIAIVCIHKPFFVISKCVDAQCIEDIWHIQIHRVHVRKHKMFRYMCKICAYLQNVIHTNAYTHDHTYDECKHEYDCDMNIYKLHTHVI
jgi:hypothetical protein